MRFQAKKDDKDSRQYWESVRRGAKEYDELPNWKKGALAGAEKRDEAPAATAPARTRSPRRRRASTSPEGGPRLPPCPSRRPGPRRDRAAASPARACSRPRRRSDRLPPRPPPRSGSAAHARPKTKAASAPAPGTASAGARNGGSVGRARAPRVHSACWTRICTTAPPPGRCRFAAAEGEVRAHVVMYQRLASALRFAPKDGGLCPFPQSSQ